MTIYKTVPVIALASILAACGSDSGSDTPEQRAKVSFSVSDAPVDTASEVVVAFDKIELQHDNGQRYIIDVDEDSQGNDYQQIDLLKYPGTEAALIITDEELPVGHYKEMIIHTVPGSMNYVEDNGQHALKIPSNMLRLGGFTVDSTAVQSFTIEFDLRKSLVLRGNESSNNGYNLKPHGVTIIDNSEASSLFGQVDPALFTAGEQCQDAGGNAVYLYAGHGHQDATLLDNLDISDPDFDKSTAVPGISVAPYASVTVDENNHYAFGYLPAGAYTVAFSCNAGMDDPIQYDSDILIANPSNQRFEIMLDKTQEKEFDFTEIVN